MAPSAVANGLAKAQEAINGSSEGGKIGDLQKDMKDVNDPKYRITTDYGVKQWNTGLLRSSTYLAIFIDSLQMTGSKSPPKTRPVQCS